MILLLAAAAPVAFGAAAERCGGAAYRSFDFWIGDWDVERPDGAPAGRNRITVEQDGCVLVERWQGATGGTGISLSFYHPTEQRWRQVWVSPGVVIDIVGGPIEGSMVLEGTASYAEGRRSAPFRGTWTPLDDGRVRQHFEEADAEGRWQPWFEGIYRRRDR